MTASNIQGFLEQLAGCCRTEAHGEFNVATARGYRAVCEPVTTEVIRAHAANQQPILVYPLLGDQTRVAVLDFDNHDGTLTWEQMADAVRPVVEGLQADGLRPHLFRSGGGGGIHVWMVWTAPQEARRVRAYLGDLLLCHGMKPGSGGASKAEAEVFPKQDNAGTDRFGSGIALPLARQSVPLDHDLQPLDLGTWPPPSEETMFSSDEALISAYNPETAAARVADRVVLDGDIEEAEAALKNVPSDDYDLWIKIGHALKGAFGGDGFRVWWEWSSKSHKAEDEDHLQKRWKSFKPRSQVTLGTIFRHGQEHGWNGPAHHLVRKYNARYGILTGGKQTLVIDKQAQHENDELLTTLSKSTFQDRHASEKTTGSGRGGQPVQIPETTVWLQHPLADHYTEVIFDPDRPSGKCGRAWNIWKGFAFVPVRGDWSLFKEHICDNIACGNELLYQWLINWMAWSVQNPGSPIGTAPVFQGLPGTGKGVVARHFGAIWKPHVIEVTHQTHVSGNFNAHLFGRRLVFIDEGIFGGDKTKAGLIKTRITEPYFVVERKGVDAIRAPNRSIYMVASNNEQPVAADIGDRRWTMFNVSAKRKEDRPYFKRIQQQMDNGGYAAMLYELMHHNWRQGPDPQKNIRSTALFEQARRGMPPEENYVFGLLDEGRLPTQPGSESNQTSIDSMWNDFKATNPSAKFASKVGLGKALKRVLGPCISTRPHRPVAEAVRQTKDGPVPAPLRSTEYTFAPLPECRRQYELHVGLPVDWSNDNDRWATGLPLPF